MIRISLLMRKISGDNYHEVNKFVELEKKSAICYHCFELKIKQPRPEKRLQCNILSPKLLLLRQI